MRTIVITGASDGIGAAAARQITSTEKDARVVLVGRSPQKTAAVAKETGAESHAVDFAHLDEVRDLAQLLDESCERIDVLANNAGGMFPGPVRTDDGFERTFQVNHLAPYLLTNLLIDKLVDSRAAVVNTSSIAARLFGKLDPADIQTWDGFTERRAYGNAKLANILFTEGLHARFHQLGLSAVAFHPGNVATNFAADAHGSFRRMYHGVLKKVLLISADEGGARLRYFIDGRAGVAWESGRYYTKPGHLGRTNPQASDPELVRTHWERSAEMLGITW